MASSPPRQTWRAPGAYLLLAPLTLLTACKSAPPPPERAPFRVPALELIADLQPGTTLAGAGAALATSGTPIAIRYRVLYIEEAYDEGLSPAATSSTLVADLFGDRPILPVGTLTAGTAIATGDAAREWMSAVDGGAAGRVKELAVDTAVVPPGATWTFEAEALESVEDPRDWLDEFQDRGPFPRRVGLWITSEADGARVTALVDDLDPRVEGERKEARSEDPNALPGPPPAIEDETVRREAVLLEAAPEPGSPLLIRVPSPFVTGEGRAFAFWVELAEEPIANGTLEAAFEVVAQESALHEERIARLSPKDRDELQSAQALEAFRDQGGRAAALLLTEDTEATLTTDLVLSGEIEILTAIKTEAFADGDPPPSQLGWRLEAASWTVLCRLALEDELTPELEGVLLRHAGALGRFPDVLLDVVAASVSTEAFSERLEVEQRYFLNDSDPSARIRAHDWFVARGHAVPDYDPLGTRAERRAALDAPPKESADPKSEDGK